MTIKAIFFAACMALAASPALADGTVLRAKGCGGKVFVSSDRGYSVLSATALDVADDGDRLVGATDKIGYAWFYIPQSDRRFSAMVEETGLSKSDVTGRIAATCRTAAVERQISGLVERSTGCGNKIFVNTVEGYAVLERLAGGLVYPGDTLFGGFARAGRTTVKDQQTGAELVVFVDDFALPKSAAQRKITETCR
ncbi:MAG TPA: hypothetical protein VK432_02260 [Stellaceae bacterium]|nr:hypothetical protein [Stellaceae bacterium]